MRHNRLKSSGARPDLGKNWSASEDEMKLSLSVSAMANHWASWEGGTPSTVMNSFSLTEGGGGGGRRLGEMPVFFCWMSPMGFILYRESLKE